jgi:hypothetical protein
LEPARAHRARRGRARTSATCPHPSAKPRTDDALKGVIVPKSGRTAPNATQPSHIEQAHAELASQLPVKDKYGNARPSETGQLRTSKDYKAYIRSRTAAWDAQRESASSGAKKSTAKKSSKKSSKKKSAKKSSSKKSAPKSSTKKSARKSKSKK